MKNNYQGRVWPRKSNFFDLREKNGVIFGVYLCHKVTVTFVTKVYSPNQSFFFRRSKKVNKLEFIYFFVAAKHTS